MCARVLILFYWFDKMKFISLTQQRIHTTNEFIAFHFHFDVVLFFLFWISIQAVNHAYAYICCYFLFISNWKFIASILVPTALQIPVLLHSLQFDANAHQSILLSFSLSFDFSMFFPLFFIFCFRFSFHSLRLIFWLVAIISSSAIFIKCIYFVRQNNCISHEWIFHVMK